MARFEAPEGWVAQAYRYALAPTPAQQRACWSHAGGARKAHNTMLGLVKAVMDAGRGTVLRRRRGLGDTEVGVVASGAASRVERP